MLGWLAWQSLMLVQLLSRVAVMEDRIGILRSAPPRGPNFLSSFELFHVPELVPRKDKK